jgi:hypothetical protein
VKVWEIAGGFGIDRLALVDRDVPTPGPGQARITQRPSSLNYRHFMVITARTTRASRSRSFRSRTESVSSRRSGMA